MIEVYLGTDARCDAGRRARERAAEATRACSSSKSVDAGYGSFQALFGVDLDVKAGEAVGVIGPNGAGKTTLMRVISGLIRPRAGTIAMEGTDVLATPPHRIVSLGIAHVPENRRLFPRLTVEDNLKMGAFMPEARGQLRERLEFVFDLFPRMKERRHQLAGTMSGGEQQMCAIGRALMSDPKLLLLDEPSAGLAPVVVQQVFELVKRIRAGGLTVLIVEQNVQQVLKVVDRAYLLEAGTHPRLRHARPRCWRATPSSRRISVCDVRNLICSSPPRLRGRCRGNPRRRGSRVAVVVTYNSLRPRKTRHLPRKTQGCPGKFKHRRRPFGLGSG